MKPLPILLATTLFALPAFAGGLPRGTIVRIEGTGIESGWHQGKITVTSDGCTMVALDKPTKDGYTLIALIATARLERQQSGTWTNVPMKPLQAQEPKMCLEEGAD